MSKNNVVALAKSEELGDALRAERARIVSDLEIIAKKRTRLAEAESAQKEILAELEAIGRREDDNVRQWVASGCDGPQPASLDKERQRINAKLASAADGARAAKAVAGEIEAAAVPLQGRLAAIDSELRTLRVTAIGNEFQDRVSDFEASASEMREALLEIRALPIALVDIGRAAFDRGDEAYARACYSAAARMRETRLPEVEPSKVEILSAVARVTEMIGSGGELRLDTPVIPAPSLGREAMMAKIAAQNQATNVISRPDLL
jgi:hypothetical protein